MAGECPHSPFLEPATLTQYHPGPVLEVGGHGNHESYLKIIGDFRNELEQISSEIVMVQKECIDYQQGQETENVGFENSLKELTTQNDRLQQALQLQTQARDEALTELQAHNEILKCQIASLQHRLHERDQRIVCLSDMLKEMSQQQTTDSKQAALEYATLHNDFTAELEKKVEMLSEKLDQSMRQEQFLHRETRKLTDELNESRRKHRESICQAQRLSGVLKTQEALCLELAAKYESLEQSHESLAKKLRAANNQLRMSEEKCQNMEVKQSEHNMESNLLREEVLSLKEKLAGALGRQKSMQDQLAKTEKELCNAHEVIKEQKNHMQRNEFQQREEKRRWQEVNSQLGAKLADLAKQHTKLQQENEHQKEFNVKQSEVLDNFRKWKDQQLKSEQSTQDVLQKYQDIIRNLLEDKQKLLAKVHDISKDYSLLQNELEILKLCPSSLPRCHSILNSSERSIPKIFEVLRSTTRRISEQNVLFKDEEPNASRDDSSSTYRPSEEPN